MILVLTLAPLFFSFFVKEKKFNYSKFKNEIAQLKIDSTSKNGSEFSRENGYNENFNTGKKFQPVQADYFLFDPNTISVNDWIRLGIREKTARTIRKYISKGGKFYKPEDIKKIWGLSPADVTRLLPHIRIKDVVKEYTQPAKSNSQKNEFKQVTKTYQLVDINLGDADDYIVLPGIGSKLSKRIIAFRDQLGGFYSIDQVAETYFLPDSTFQKIKPYLVLNDEPLKKININKATIDEMKLHPYINYNLANAIFQYRNQHGNFISVDDIKKIMMVTDDLYHKVFPYLTIK
ncbi:MAG: helix-hairpin-helix domain-containing protein [Bacteroidota bacterium]|nr:helix-hairpin-helix domain-containing protein [Bacteroidota bacterium]